MVQILSRHDLVLPGSVSSLIKMFAMLEGTAKLISPSLNVLEMVKAYQTKSAANFSPRKELLHWRRVMMDWRRVGETLPARLGRLMEQVEGGKFEVHLEHRRLEPSVNRLAMGMITSALFLGSAILWSRNVPPTIGGYSAFGVAGYAVSITLGLRLAVKIWRE